MHTLLLCPVSKGHRSLGVLFSLIRQSQGVSDVDIDCLAVNSQKHVSCYITEHKREICASQKKSLNNLVLSISTPELTVHCQEITGCTCEWHVYPQPTVKLS